MADRAYDLVIYGATGFTGQLVAEYLARHAGTRSAEEPLRWALAGRSREKLRRVADALPEGADVGLIEADAGDGRSLEAMAAQARVLVTTVGPYAQLGEPLVKACLAAGTDYLDITGEPAFVDQLIERYDAEARDAGVLIINCCGFDSIPADLGTLFTVQQLPDGAPKSVRAYVKTRGTPSGGTWASLIGALADGIPKKAGSRGSGAGGTKRSGPKRKNMHREPLVGGWSLPMPVIDPLVVKRSSRAHPAYGEGFRYAQYLRLGSLAQVASLMGGIAGLFALSQTAPTRRWLLSRRPSGAGPSEEERAKGFFALTFIGESAGKQVVTRVSGGDPGYDETSKMLSESALLVASARDTLPIKGGVVTPAAAMGEALIERLQAVGIQFEVVSS